MASFKFNRRMFLLRGAVAAGVLLAPRGVQSLVAAAADCGGNNIKVRKSLEMAAAKPGDAVWMNAFYTRGAGGDMASYMSVQRKSDVQDDIRRRFSADNGRTWSDWEAVADYKAETPQGTRRRYPQPGWVDPCNGRLLMMVMDGVLPRDNPMEGMTRWSLGYGVSIDGGRTFAVDEPVIQKGDYTAEHPAEGVWIGKNSMMIGATTCRPIRTRRGEILVPVQITPLGPDGKYWNPGGGFTYHDAAVLIGRWTEGMKFEWELSERVAADPARSTRGCLEPTVAEMPDGRILMVCRGSNDAKPKLPGYKWFSISRDGGRTWSKPQPWTYYNGKELFSSSSCSQLLRHTNGQTYWLGNIAAANPQGNMPRHPLHIGRVDPTTLGLIEESVGVIDDKGPTDADALQLSNFLAYEDRETGEIVLHLTRLTNARGIINGDAWVYRIGVERH